MMTNPAHMVWMKLHRKLYLLAVVDIYGTLWVRPRYATEQIGQNWLVDCIYLCLVDWILIQVAIVSLSPATTIAPANSNDRQHIHSSHTHLPASDIQEINYPQSESEIVSKTVTTHNCRKRNIYTSHTCHGGASENAGNSRVDNRSTQIARGRNSHLQYFDIIWKMDFVCNEEGGPCHRHINMVYKFTESVFQWAHESRTKMVMVYLYAFDRRVFCIFFLYSFLLDAVTDMVRGKKKIQQWKRHSKYIRM